VKEIDMKKSENEPRERERKHVHASERMEQ